MGQLEAKIYEGLCKTQQAQAHEILKLRAQVQWYEQQLGLSRLRQFAPSSEASTIGEELLLFNEAVQRAFYLTLTHILTVVAKTPGRRTDSLRGAWRDASLSLRSRRLQVPLTKFPDY